ncbi:calcineurin-like phosphoesterase family protein [Belliella sp. R4-6]|uniref:Calcineurin-like phosphoesterase family protein n=1 Tax=Belliella alkalica TaxID=1730871 RepID=A0ABS9VC70_9BACT|nr:calcineurin-like phosphoesterase family protein [Belliella alkalica]MCH7413829.1 calcineurin-like phosphoesterase family protein [Belliella alkalica]
MKKIISSIIITLFVGNISAQQMAKGIIYEDLNGNGKKDRNEKGISGVGVSNGTDVVATNEKGEYSLEVNDGELIFVIKPSGYSLPLNEYNFPKHYYIHKPTGSPELKYKGSAPTEPLPKSIDFGLQKATENKKFTSLVFGDPQPYNLEEVGYFEKAVVEHVKGIEDVEFGISLGDLVGDDLSLFPAYSEVMAKIGIPWYNIMGNHDQNYDVDSDKLTDETFEAHFGPATSSFNYADVHVILLENILYPDPRDGVGYWGGFREDQLTFIENDLKLVPKDKLIILAMHIPLFEEGDSFRDADREKLFELLADYPNTLSFSAHTHYQRQDFFGKDDGWKQEKPHHHYNVGTPSGDWYKGILDEKGYPVSTMRDGTPKGYVFLDIDGNQYKTRYQVAGKSSEYQIEVFTPKVIEQGKRTTSGIYANFFMGTEGNEVNYRINDGKWTKMNYLEDYDPKYLVDLLQWDISEELLDGRRPSLPQKSMHLWRANIPNNLPVGKHTVEVEAIDMYGQKHVSKTEMEVRKK